MHKQSPISYNGHNPKYVPLPPPPRRKSRRSRKWPWFILGILAGLVLAGVAFYLIGVFASGAQNTAISQNNPIGVPVVVNSDWIVTLKSVTISYGNKFDHPAPEYIYLVVNVMLQNTSTRILTASSTHMFDIEDANTGQTYQQDIGFGQSPDGTVASDGFLRGRIAYEVPAGHHNFTLQFAPNVNGSVLAEWSVMI